MKPDVKAPTAIATTKYGFPGCARPYGLSCVREMLSHPLGSALVRAVLLAIFLVAWQLSPDRLTPWISKPSSICQTLWDWSMHGFLMRHLLATLSAMMAGYIAGTVAGVFIGIVLGLAPFAERVLSPIIVALYSIPKIAIAPLLVILFGIGIESKIVLVTITVFFMMMFSAIDGIRDVDQDIVATLRQMGATKLEVILKVLLPGSLAWIFTGLRLCIRLAFTAAILGEIISSNRGLGYLIESSAVTYDSTGVFAAITIVVLFSVAITEFVTFVEKSTSRWRANGMPARHA